MMMSCHDDGVMIWHDDDGIISWLDDDGVMMILSCHDVDYVVMSKHDDGVITWHDDMMMVSCHVIAAPVVPILSVTSFHAVLPLLKRFVELLTVTEWDMLYKYRAVVYRTVDSRGDSMMMMMMIEVDTVAGTAVIHDGVKVVADQQSVCVYMCDDYSSPKCVWWWER